MAEKKAGPNRLISDLGLQALMEVHPLEVGDGYYTFFPLTDVIETKDYFIVEVEVPGVRREDLVIEVSDNYIYVSGKKERNLEEENSANRFYCMGRTYGAFKRIFEIPSPFNMHQVKAKLERGLLTIKLPKILDKRQRKIKVEIE